jgi:hypothetical protein
VISQLIALFRGLGGQKSAAESAKMVLRMSLRTSAQLVALLISGCGRIGFGPGEGGDSGPTDSGGMDGTAGDGAADATVDSAIEDAAADAGLDPDLVVWLPFDVDDPIDATDVTGVLTNPQCEAGRCPASVAGVFGQALSFDGVDDYLRFDTSPMLDFGASAQPFTVTVWYRTNSRGPAQQVVYAQATGGGDVSYQLSFEDLDGAGTYDVVWKVCESDCPSETFAQLVDGVDVDAWRFAAGVWTGTESILYLDGVEQARTETNDVKFDGEPFMVGSDWETGGSIEDSFDGEIDDLRIYRRVLTVPEQMELMVGAGR